MTYEKKFNDKLLKEWIYDGVQPDFGIKFID